MKVLLLILVFIGIAFLEIPELLKKKYTAELVTSLVLLGAGFLLSLLQIVGVKVPNPNNGIEFLIKLIIK